MKNAFSAMVLGLALLAGGSLAGCKSCCDRGSSPGTAGCPGCKDGKMGEACREKMMANCPDCKAAGGMCEKCKEKCREMCKEMMANCPDCKAAGGPCEKCKEMMMEKGK